MEQDQFFDYLIVGGGIVGAATAYKLSEKYPEKSIALVEKEGGLGMHQTGRNSGVIHSGIYYRPGSLKAENCRIGREQLVAFARKYDIPHKICGKIIVATSEQESLVLDRIFQNGLDNKTPGIECIDRDEISRREPYIKGVKAIWVPSAGIIDYVEVVKTFVRLLLEKNSVNHLFLDEKVIGLHRENNLVQVKTSKQSITSKEVIVCGGLFSDRLARLDKVNLKMQIVGFRGDYYELKPNAKHKVNNLVYPVPDPRYPFLGVHYTPMVGGEVECGPNAVFTFKREGYRRTSFNLKDSLEALTYKGTIRLFAKNWKKGIEEYRRAFSKKLFVKELQKMMPSIKEDEVKATRSGVRAQAVGENGEMIDDFKIIHTEGVTHVINAPSPAATACLAVADEIIAGLS
ncbi:L-2-hydroxyglutarate oxidase [Lutimonas zeaxanthinifaciens]|uniref:L-2-hydroxyglutarate oxidase n=1 Tax=Lutimonas zeaxanthinifaciens TaxID=3060215 RepID=UPI00265CD634|nr:L-2-hydroxyglutarate oxidase [Lutimonas sp. YSD2104]WKK65050.1 L-2-hydroxyglutarate oxidase [Lutimonas sp. YSD2104]